MFGRTPFADLDSSRMRVSGHRDHRFRRITIARFGASRSPVSEHHDRFGHRD
jgi:hypothetical protein